MRNDPTSDQSQLQLHNPDDLDTAMLASQLDLLQRQLDGLKHLLTARTSADPALAPASAPASAPAPATVTGMTGNTRSSRSRSSSGSGSGSGSSSDVCRLQGASTGVLEGPGEDRDDRDAFDLTAAVGGGGLRVGHVPSTGGCQGCQGGGWSDGQWCCGVCRGMCSSAVGALSAVVLSLPLVQWCCCCCWCSGGVLWWWAEGGSGRDACCTASVMLQYR